MNPQQEVIQKVRALLVNNYGGFDVHALRRAFDTYDADKDGHLDVVELTRVFTDAGIGNRLTRGMWVKGVLDGLAAERDDALSWEEFAATAA